MNSLWPFSSSLLAFGLILGLTACERERLASPAIENVKNEPKISSGATEKIGILACDIYLEKYAQCITRGAPLANREQLNKGLEQTREAWKKAAATIEGKNGLIAACTTALEVAKKSLAGYKCDW